MLEISKISKKFGNVQAIKKIDLNIEKGQIFGFIGPNGAGKSTTIKCVLNFLKNDEGTIKLDGKPITDKDKEFIGYLPAEVKLYEDLTVMEMIKYNNTFYKKNYLSNAKKLMKRLNLNPNKKIDELSLGNLKKIGLILSLMHEPKLIILDEPTSGLDPLMQEIFYEIIKEQKEAGNTIFFSSHNLIEVKKLCDMLAIIKNGKIISIGKIEELTKNSISTITINAKDLKKQSLIIPGMKLIDLTNNTIKFHFDGDINELISKLTKFKIDHLTIEEPTLEEIFMHYYKEDSK